VQVTFRNAKGERVRQRLRVFDFEDPENNHFLCVRELWVRGDLYRRRADIVGFVNGLNEGKNNGMIVDYCGILKNLRKALATFAGTGDDGRGGKGGETEPAKPDEELLADLAEAIETQTGLAVSGILPHTAFVHPWTAGVAEELPPYDISKIDFDRLRREFERSPAKRTTVQNLKSAIEQRLQRLLQQNPLRTDFQRHYQEIVAEYNREKDRVTIEKTFEALLQIMDEMGDEESRAVREGLDEESLAVFDLLRKPNLTSGDIKRIKAVAVDLLETLKAEKLRINHWRDKESTRDAVRLTIQDYLWSEQTGLPETYSEEDVRDKTEAVFVHVFRAYPTVPSPYYASMAS
jgi:type I site-specific restriction-modification system R (restriction) subunit